jgi:hypothetical protein
MDITINNALIVKNWYETGTFVSVAVEVAR